MLPCVIDNVAELGPCLDDLDNLRLEPVQGRVVRIEPPAFVSRPVVREAYQHDVARCIVGRVGRWGEVRR